MDYRNTEDEMQRCRKWITRVNSPPNSISFTGPRPSDEIVRDDPISVGSTDDSASQRRR